MRRRETQRRIEVERIDGEDLLEQWNRYGVLLGATGALVAFFASSLVNYNFGDGEVALVFWWLLGIVVVLTASSTEIREPSAN